MEYKNKLKVCRDFLRLVFSIIFVPLYVPHYVAFLLSKSKAEIEADLSGMAKGLNFHLNHTTSLIYFLHNDSYFRSLFYYRIGAIASYLIKWWRPGNATFIISQTTKMGPGMKISHPYSTILNAKAIGANFDCRHLTTLGNKGPDNDSRPTIGDNVFLGAAVCIIGDVVVGDNSVVGAGSVVINDIEPNSIVAGNPARLISKIRNLGEQE